MSSGVSDLLKRQPASEKHMEESDAIPWSQQVEEALYETLPSTTTDNKSSGLSTSTQFQNPPFIVRAESSINEKQKKTYANDTKNKCTKQHSCNDSRWNACNCGDKGANISKLSYNIKKDNSTVSQRMPRDPPKPFFGNTSGNDDMKKVPNYSNAENSTVLNDANSNKKKITWASIASQPAKPNKKNNNMVLKKKGPGMPPPPMIPGKHNLDINAWEFSSNVPPADAYGPVATPIPTSEHSNSNDDSDTTANRFRPTNIEQQSTFSRKQVNHYSNKPTKNIKVNNRPVDSRERERHYNPQVPNEERSHSVGKNINCMQNTDSMNSESYEPKTCEDSDAVSRVESAPSDAEITSHIVLKKLRDRNNYNPSEIDMEKAALSRFFVIKSYSEDDIHRSIKYEIWCSTDHGNKRLDEAFKERVKEGGNVMLFFSVNGSGHFCGMAQMMTSVDYKSTSSVWSQDKWKGKFKVKWIYVKDVPNSQLRHIRLENNDNKSVTNSRDTQEVPNNKGLQVLRVLHLYKHQTSIFDDFYHYEKKQEESVLKKPAQYDNFVHPSSSSNMSHNDVKDQNNDRVFGNFRERIISHRGSGGGHHNFLGNRRYAKGMDMPSGKDDKDKPNSHSSAAEREDNETHSLRRHTNLSSENCNNSNSKRNFRDIILHMNNFNCNDSNAVGENNESKLT